MANISFFDQAGLHAALEQARKSYSEGGIPIGAALVSMSLGAMSPFQTANQPPEVQILGSGHNRRMQDSSPILHGETAALDNAGRLQANVYRRATMVSDHAILCILKPEVLLCWLTSIIYIQFTTLRYKLYKHMSKLQMSLTHPFVTSPCSMCTGAILLYKIPRVVIGENETFKGEEDLLRSRGVEVVVLDNQECKDLMRKFIEEKPEVSPYLESFFPPVSDGIVACTLGMV